MKKYIAVLLILMACVGLIYGIKGVIDKSEEKRVSSLVWNYSEAYCLMRSTENLFWKDYYSERYEKQRNENNTDIPTMNILGKISLNRLEQNHTKDILGNCEKASPEMCESLTFAYSYLLNFLEGSAELGSFEEFQSDVLPEVESFREVIKQAPGILDFKIIRGDVNVSDTDNSVVEMMEEMCNARIQAFQEGMSY